MQPKILVRDENAFGEMEHSRHRLSASYRGATHIVKLWDANEYPQLAANEYFCLMTARKCGLDVPPFRLAEDGLALVIDRLDLQMDKPTEDSRISAHSMPEGRGRNIGAATRLT